MNDQQTDGNQFPKYTPSDQNVFNLFESKPDEIDFKYDEGSGQFQFVPKQAQQQDQNQQTQTQQGQQQQTQQTQANPNDDKFTQIDQRFGVFEQALTRIAGFLDAMSRGNQQQGQQQQTQQPEVKLDLQSDDFATNLISIINSAIDTKFKTLEEKITPLQQVTDQMNDRMRGADLALQYGPEFAKLFPVMQVLKNSDPNKSWEQVFADAKKMSPFLKLDSTIQNDNGTQQQALPNQPQSSQNQHQQLQQAASQMATETGGMSRTVVNQQQESRTIESAFEKAIADLSGGRP
jgi:hypothetical protein